MRQFFAHERTDERTDERIAECKGEHMSLYLRIQQALSKMINGPKDPIASFEIEQQINEAHMAALMKTKEFRIDGF